MPNILIRISKKTKKTLQEVALVEETTMTGIVREALSEYIDGLDLKWYAKQLEDFEVSPEELEDLEAEDIESEKEEDEEEEKEGEEEEA